MRNSPSLLQLPLELTDRPTLLQLLTPKPSRELINFVKCPSS